MILLLLLLKGIEGNNYSGKPLIYCGIILIVLLFNEAILLFEGRRDMKRKLKYCIRIYVKGND